MPLITSKMPDTWQELEQTVADILSECGMDSERTVTRKLPRGSVDIDVIATETNDGIQNIVVCECKNWKHNIPKEIVHAFRTVMHEIGANRGYIISRVGFQSGAYEAAEATNINLVTFEEFQERYFARWYKARLWQIENNVGNFNRYFEPFGQPGYDLLSTEKEYSAYHAIWKKYEYAAILLMHFSPYLGFTELGPPPLPFEASKMEASGYAVPDDIKLATGYRELLQKLENIAAEGLAEFREVNPITRGRDPATIDRDDYPPKD